MLLAEAKQTGTDCVGLSATQQSFYTIDVNSVIKQPV
jgi:hypothetical protein